jgi:hypothetical protein
LVDQIFFQCVDGKSAKAVLSVAASVEHAATLGIDLEIAQRTPGTRGFTPIPKRWTVERTYGWLILHRRLTGEAAISSL